MREIKREINGGNEREKIREEGGEAKTEEIRKQQRGKENQRNENGKKVEEVKEDGMHVGKTERR